MLNKILRLPAVQNRTGLSRAAIYLKISRREFPKQFHLGNGRSVGWLESDINDWIEACARENRIVAGELSCK